MMEPNGSVQKPLLSMVFVPGAWHRTSCYNTVIEKLHSTTDFSCNVVAVELSSVGADPGSAATWSFLPDVQAIEAAISQEIDNGRHVLIVSHSYGSIPTQEALHRFIKSGKVAQLIIAGFLLEQGESLLALAGGMPPPWYDRKGDFLDVRDPGNIFYNDLPEAEQKEHIANLKPHAYVTKISPQMHPSYLHIPTTYLLCTRDNANLAVWQEGMLARAMDKHGATHIAVRKVESGHSPFLSKPDEVVEILLEILKGMGR